METSEQPHWKIFTGSRTPHDFKLPEPPPWRKFQNDESAPVVDVPAGDDRDEGNPGRGQFYCVDAAGEQVRYVNAAIHLRRPLLVTGKPGVGKSSLAYAIAYELKLGPVLRWSITSRASLLEGLYRYDAVGRLQETQMHRDRAPDIGKYVQLGPLGTALLPTKRPRVLLIDEIDKSDFDLPNDLLHVFEEGEYEIPELARLDDSQSTVNVRLFGADNTAPIVRGRVRCREFPVVVMTSNGERDFPAPFLRRCLRLDIAPPDKDALTEIVTRHLGTDLAAEANATIQTFFDAAQSESLANDQLLNLMYLLKEGLLPDEWKDLSKPEAGAAKKDNGRTSLLRSLES
jgi:MoxR-like ATPase